MFASPGPIALQIGPLSIRWYGLLMATAMGLGLWLAYRDAKRRGLDPESLLKASELGLLGALLLLGLFATLLVRGLRVARSAPNLFGSLLAAGITLTVCLQAFINAGMSIGLLPTKGMPMPFISYGGSSLLVTLAAAGVLLNISKQSSMHARYTAHGAPALAKEGPWPGATGLLGGRRP